MIDRKKLRTNRDLAKNSFKNFKNHFLAEELHAQYCIYSKLHKEYFGGGKEGYDEEILLFNEFIEKYPTSKYLDEFEWEIVQMENHSYGYEGFAHGPIDR